MNCPNCGEKLRDGASFCTKCGSAVSTSDRPAPPAQAQPPRQNGGSGKRAAVIVAIIVAILAIGGVIGYQLWHADQERKAEEQRLAQEQWEKDHQTYPMQIAFVVPEYDESTSTRIPVLVQGSDFEGNTVSEYHALAPSTNSFELMRGDYTVQIAGSPINGEGRIYSFPSDPIKIEIDESGAHLAKQASETADAAASGEDAEAKSKQDENATAEASGSSTSPAAIPAQFEFSLIQPEDVSDEQIAQAKDALVNAGVERSIADEFCDRVIAVRQQRLDQIAAEAAEAARRANPEYVDGSTSEVTLKGTLVRENWPKSKTGMGWSAVAYFLEFETPVTVTFNRSGAHTETVTRLQVTSVEQYDKDADVNLSARSDPGWEAYVGNFVAVSGKLIHTGNAHTLGIARFQAPRLVEVF